jgi:hypothetical protein
MEGKACRQQSAMGSLPLLLLLLQMLLRLQ